MPDADKSLDILIKTKADLKDAMALQRELQSSRTKAQLLGKDFSEVDNQLKRVGTAIDGYKARNKDAGEEVDELHASHDALRQIMSMIGGQTGPELPEALTGAFQSAIEGAMAFGKALDDVGKKLEAIHQKAGDLATLKWDTMASSADEFAKSLQGIDFIDKQNREIEEAKKHQQEATGNQTAVTQGQSDLEKNRKLHSEEAGGADISTAIEISRRADAGGSVSGDEHKYVAMIGGLAADQAVNVKQAETMFNLASRNQASMESFTTRLAVMLNKLGPNFETLSNVLANLETRMTQFESKLKDLKNP